MALAVLLWYIKKENLKHQKGAEVYEEKYFSKKRLETVCDTDPAVLYGTKLRIFHTERYLKCSLAKNKSTEGIPAPAQSEKIKME